jgi:hypothetical protein
MDRLELCSRDRLELYHHGTTLHRKRSLRDCYCPGVRLSRIRVGQQRRLAEQLGKFGQYLV